MAVETETTPTHKTPRALRRSVVAAGVGNALEWFDWNLYGILSVYLAANFFDPTNSTSALLATLAVFAVGFVARPIGGLLFGQLGDRIGRKAVMIITMVALATSSVAIAMLPTFEQVGVLASLLLLVVRLVQGLAHGGEAGISYTYVAEIAPAKKRGLWSSSVYVASTVGLMGATSVAAILTNSLSNPDMLQWGWRIGFAAGGVLGIFALILRRTAVESQVFENALEESKELPAAAAPRLRAGDIARIALRIIMLSVGINVSFYVWVTFAPTNAIAQHGIPAGIAFVVSLIAQGLILIALPLLGALSDRIGRKPLVLTQGALMVLLAFPIALIVGPEAWSLFVAVLLGNLVWAFVGAIYPALLAEQAPTRVRATIVGFVSSLSVAIFGGTGPYLNTWLISIGQGWIFTVYIMLLGVIVFLGGLLIKEGRGIELSTLDDEVISR